MKFIGLVAAAICFLTVSASAGADKYTCLVKPSGKHTWLAEKTVILYETTNGTVTVDDPIVRYFNDGKPISGEVVVDNEKRTTFRWEFAAKDADRQYSSGLMYRVTYIKKTGKAHATMQPKGYHNVFQGQGRCEVK